MLTRATPYNIILLASRMKQMQINNLRGVAQLG